MRLLVLPALLTALILLTGSRLNAQYLSENGYPEHFIVGAAICSGVSYLAYKKTDHKLKAWGIGLATAVAIGGLKEMSDSLILDGTRSIKDFKYTMLGGALGANIVIPLRGRKGEAKISPSPDHLIAIP